MSSDDLKAIIPALAPVCRKALEDAARHATQNRHPAVDIEHWVLRLLEASESGGARLLERAGAAPENVLTDLRMSLSAMTEGLRTTQPALAVGLVELLKESATTAQIAYGERQIGAAHVLMALTDTPTLALRVAVMSPELARLDGARVAEAFHQLRGDGALPRERGEAPHDGPLEAYCTDLTAAAKAGKVDPVLGREGEIRQMIDILLRRRQNNPILTGEAGVGKTAVVEGLALKIAAGDVPTPLKSVRLLSLDLALLQAGAGIKGEFEDRLKSFIEAVKSSAQPIVVFIDEAHTLIGAGGAEGQGDAANLLKPALARGDMRTIAATTWAEYKKYFEKDPALTRRFQLINVKEPSQDMAVAILRGVAPVLSRHHGVDIRDDAVVAAVKLSARYLQSRQLPDKAISLLDTAASRVALSQSSLPGAVEDLRRDRDALDREIAAKSRDQAEGVKVSGDLDDLKRASEALGEEIASLEAKWAEERAHADKVTALKVSVADRSGEALAAARAVWATLQNGNPLVYEAVDEVTVAEVLADWTGIPLGRMATDTASLAQRIDESLRTRIKGQDRALDAIASAMRISAAGLNDPQKPVAVFMYFGTSGVGKTETAYALADQLYGGDQAMTVINMSEFKEEHKTSMLLGAPPGFVGFGEGGVLTEAIRRRPYGIVLLDEMEKAHPGVQDVFYQAFDKGILKDGEGRDIDCRNTVFIMTSNAGSDTIADLAEDPDTMPEGEVLLDAVKPDLLAYFKPAFLGRVTLVPYVPLGQEVVREIVELQLGRLAERVAATYDAPLTWTPAVADAITNACTDGQSGARNIDAVLRRTISPRLATEFLSRITSGEKVVQVQIDVDSSGSYVYEVKAADQRTAG